VNTYSLARALTTVSACTLLALAGWQRWQVSESAPQPATAQASMITFEAPAQASDPSAHDVLEAWVSGLAAELLHEPYEPRAFAERLSSCTFDWTSELQSELVSMLASAPPSAQDQDLVALASIGRAQAVPLSAGMVSRLRPLAESVDVPFGLSLESARALVAGLGSPEVDTWCSQLEAGNLDERAFSVASGALDAVHVGEELRHMIARALDIIGDEDAAGRLIDAAGRCLAEHDAVWISPGSEAASGRLLERANDTLAGAGLRARSLTVLAYIDLDMALPVASDWMLDPATSSERIGAAAAALHGRPETLATLEAAQADVLIDEARRVRLAECLLFTPAAQLSAEARAAGLAQMRLTLTAGTDPAARRRALHALARFGTDEDRAQVQLVADTDADTLSRAAARTALLREASEWR